MNIRLFSNVIGATLDKSLPLIISIILTNYMSQDTFGVWTQYFQVLIIVASGLISPIQLFFSREFYTVNDKRVKISNGWVIIAFFSLCFLITKIFLKELIEETSAFLLIVTIFLFIIYSLNATFLRFIKNDLKYAKYSFLRMLVFAILVGINGSRKGIIEIGDLVWSFMLCHLPFIIFLKKNISLRLNMEMKKRMEYLRLMIYGLSTALLSGVDKLIVVKAGYTYEELGYYAYALAFASLPSFLIEAVKQYMSPKLFEDLSNSGDYSRNSVNLLIKFIIVLIAIQFIGPIIAFNIFKFFGLVNISYIGNNELIPLIMMFNIGFSFHIIYHFVNPYMFFYDRSFYLLIIQLISILIYSLLVFLSDDLNDVMLSVYRIIMFFIVVLCTVIPVVNKKMRMNYVFKKL